MADIPKRRARRQFTDEFKASAVGLVLDEGKTVGAAARDLDLTETALREWVKRARADRTHGRTGLTTAEREELTRLRKEVRILAEEREILKKAAFVKNLLQLQRNDGERRKGPSVVSGANRLADDSRWPVGGGRFAVRAPDLVSLFSVSTVSSRTSREAAAGQALPYSGRGRRSPLTLYQPTLASNLSETRQISFLRRDILVLGFFKAFRTNGSPSSPQPAEPATGPRRRRSRRHA
jgi:transposase